MPEVNTIELDGELDISDILGVIQNNQSTDAFKNVRIIIEGSVDKIKMERTRPHRNGGEIKTIWYSPKNVKIELIK